MPQYVYRCRTSTGELREGILQAENAGAARAALVDRDWTILRLQGEPARSPQPDQAKALVSPVSVRELILFTTRLSALLAAGIGIVRALEVAGDGPDRNLQTVTTQVSQRVIAGERLSQAMHRYPQAFPEFYRQLIRMGEETGSLTTVLERLTAHLRRTRDQSLKLQSALIYPAVVLMVVGLMVLFLAFFLVPQMSGMLTGMGVELPWLTRLVIALAHPRLVTVVGLTMALGAVWLWAVRRTPVAERLRSTLLYCTPGLAALSREALLARLMQSLSLLLEAGMGWPRAVRLLGRTGCLDFDEPLERFAEGLEQGGFQESIQSCPIFPPLLKGLLLTGLETRSVTRFLDCYVELTESRLELVISTWLQILEPILLLVLGLVVGLVVMAAFLPVYRLMFTL